MYENITLHGPSCPTCQSKNFTPKQVIKSGAGTAKCKSCGMDVCFAHQFFSILSAAQARA